MIAAFLLALSFNAAAQTDPPQTSSEAVTAIVKTPAAAPAVIPKPAQASPQRPIYAKISPESKKWKPISLSIAGDFRTIRTAVSFRSLIDVKKIKTSPAKASAKVHGGAHSFWLVYSLWPKVLEVRRKHIEVRVRMVEKFVEEVRCAVVRVTDPRPGVGAGLDSDELRFYGVEFEEISGEAGRIEIAALDPRPSPAAKNAGRLRAAVFSDRDLNRVDLSWSTAGLPPSR